MTVTELRQDIQILKDFPTYQQKKELSEKYRVDSMKAKEIIFIIELILFDIVDKSSDDFLETWLRHYDYPISVAKVKSIVTNEDDPIAIRKILSYYKSHMNNGKYSRYASAYKSIVKYLSELLNNPNKDSDIQQMTNKLIEITATFNANLLTASLEKAKHYYSEIQRLNSYNLDENDFKSLFGTTTSKKNSGEKLYKSKISSLKFNGCEIVAKEINSYRSMNSTAKRLSTDCCLLKKKTLGKYLEKVSEDFNAWYQAQMQRVVVELIKKGLTNPDSLRVTVIDTDKKGFYSVITDENITVMTRAIPCCADSDLISFHYRFISTIVK